MKEPSLDQITRGLQEWAGAAADGDFGKLSVSAAWEKAGRPLRAVDRAELEKPVVVRAIPWLGELWDTVETRSMWKMRAIGAADRIRANRSRYESVEAVTGCPWWVIGLIHLLEGNLNFGTHLHNGDSLKRRTVQVPRGRPKTGEPPFTWEESAIDAIRYDKLDDRGEDFWEQPSLVLDALERYNGLGYRKKPIHSPYLWSGTNHYTCGKYVADGRYDANAVSNQVGAVPVIKELGVL